MDSNESIEEIIQRIETELKDHIVELEKMIKGYGSFNVIANSFARNNIQTQLDNTDQGIKATITEYVALICLKFPFSIGHGEFMRTREVAKDFFKIDELAKEIINKSTFLHFKKFSAFNNFGEISDLEYLAQTISSEELLVRNVTFESFHWDLLEELYEKYNIFFKEELGFDVNEAIRISLTIADYIQESFLESLERFKTNSNQMYNEIIAYKNKKIVPQNFYPPDYLRHYETMSNEVIKKHFEESMMTYEMVMMGHTLSFSAKEIAEMESIDLKTVINFLEKLKLDFGDIDLDFSNPEIIHPLKEKPLIYNDQRYIVPSISLLDYSLDKLFYDTILKNPSKNKTHKDHRHDYLLKKGMEYLSETLKTEHTYTNLYYPGGEMDGLIFCGSNIFFIEAKAHKFSDRAKKGLIDRIEKHIKEVIKTSYSQAIRTYNYLFGKDDVPFKDKSGKNIVLNCKKYTNAYFITLTLDDFTSMSCNLKVNNSLGLFSKETFPWIISLYNLRAVCEHMEGPAYFIQYLHRRKEFFNYKKFLIHDELDILGYYLKRNLRFDDIIEKQYAKSNLLHLESVSDEFNRYYDYINGNIKKPIPKMTHYSNSEIKTIVKKLEDHNQIEGIDAAVQLLELGSKTKKEFLEYIRRIKKKRNKDDTNHDFRIAGDDVNDKKWMFSYWVGPDILEFERYFEEWVNKKFQDEPTNNYIAILDTGKIDYKISKIIHLKNDNIIT